ncbi:MAG: hypothetical protein KC518_13820, partial [Candidatus Cloacimonetes bacterium]|nr:hypothetical protein [Candidatus Cloacimonadota bacterium]
MSQLPIQLQAGLLLAASDLGSSYKKLGWLNGNLNTPMPERHTVVHLGTAFHKLGFALGAEVLLKPVVGSRRHLDLLVHSGAQAFLFEVKTFGSWKFSEVLWDVERLCEFGIDGENEGPQTVPFTEGNPLKLPFDSHRDFWESSNERWGCVVIQCFRDEKFGKLWAGFDTRSINCEATDDYRLFGPAKTKELNELKKALTTL